LRQNQQKHQQKKKRAYTYRAFLSLCVLKFIFRFLQEDYQVFKFTKCCVFFRHKKF